MTERLLTAAEVADLVGVSPDTVIDWHEARKIPSFKVGRAVRFRRDEIDAWLETKRTGSGGVGMRDTEEPARAAKVADDATNDRRECPSNV
jgi:excisionase family DNA binding protein